MRVRIITYLLINKRFIRHGQWESAKIPLSSKKLANPLSGHAGPFLPPSEARRKIFRVFQGFFRENFGEISEFLEIFELIMINNWINYI